MNSLRQPDELKLTGNVDENWKAFKQSFELYTLAVGLKDNEEKRKIAVLLTVAGRAALDVYNTFVFADEEKDKYGAVIEKFDQYCTPKKNVTYERYVFRSRIQKESESIEQYVTDLRLKSRSCEFGTLCDSLITDQIVIGVRDKNVRMQLLKATDLTLEKAIKICQTFESTRLQIQTFDNGAAAETVEVDAVRLKDNRRGKDKANRKEPKQGSAGSTGCNRCGNRHAPKQCPAFGKDCRKCGGKNHFAKCCFSKKKVQFVENKDDSGSAEEDTPLFVETVTLVDKDSDSEEEKRSLRSTWTGWRRRIRKRTNGLQMWM